MAAAWYGPAGLHSYHSAFLENPLTCVFNRLTSLIIAAILMGLLSLSGVISSLSNKTMDGLFLLRGPVSPRQDIILIGVDDESLAELGPWPFSRRYHARLLARLHGAKVIGFDFLFSEPGSEDAVFDRAMRVSPPVVLASVIGDDRLLLPTASLSHAFGHGHIQIMLGSGGVVRNIILKEQTGAGPLSAFAVVMAEAAGKTVPADRQRTIAVNHYGPPQTFLYLSYADVLRGYFPKGFFDDRFVLVGAEALGIGDSHVTPFTRRNQTPGVEIQATILANLLSRSWLKPMPVASLVIMAGIALMWMFLWPGKSERYNLSINILLAVILAAASVICFSKTLFLNPAPPLLFLLLCYLGHLVGERIWTAKNIYLEMIHLDKQLKNGLQQVYANIPSQVFKLSPTPVSGGVRRHLARLRAGVKALSLQHHFIENLLGKELPPLILWDHQSGEVIIANAMFKEFWKTFGPAHNELPDIETFLRLPADNPADDDAQAFPPLSRLFDKGPSPCFDISLTNLGQKKIFQINIHAVVIEDIDFHGILALLTDVTEVKELERLKDEIVAVVSHELKLPLTVILGYGEILSARLQGEDKLHIDKICEQARRQNKLIETFLDITRLEHGRREPARLPLDPISLVEEAVAAVAPVAAGKEIRIIKQLPRKASPLSGDFTLLMQAVTNLLDNAIKFSPKQTEITVTLVEEPDNFIIRIADQGPGIPAESQDTIFEKFNRGQQEPGLEGFGLGLNFVRQVIGKHGGTIRLEPATDSGATFCISLPKKSFRPFLMAS